MDSCCANENAMMDREQRRIASAFGLHVEGLRVLLAPRWQTMLSHVARCMLLRKAPLLSLVAGCLLLVNAAAHAQTTNRIVAVVNDEVITEADVTAYANALREERPDNAAPDSHSVEMQRVVLRRLIEQRLILQEAKRAGIAVGTEEILERLDALRSRFDSDEAFERSLTESNLTKEQLKEKVREQLMVQHLIDAKVRSAVLVSPQEVAKELAVHPELAKEGDRIRVSHILVRVNEKRPEERARVRVKEIYQQVSTGGDFAALAKRYSEDPHAEDGGAMGWVAEGELMPELDVALATLKPGEYSRPIQTRLGYHLLKVEERQSVASLTAPEANTAVYQQIYQRKFQEAFGRWLDQLKRRAYIELPEQ